MVNKTKNRVRPRSRLLAGLFVLVGLSAVIAVAVMSNFKAKQGYFVYEVWEDGFLNLYVYDVATEEIRPITDSGDRNSRYHFVTARNAPLVAYYEWSNVPGYTYDLMLYNARTGHTEQIGSGAGYMSLHPDGDFLVYDHITPDIFSDDFDPEEFDVIRAETRLLDLRTGEEQVVYSRRHDQYTLIGDYQWTEESLIFSLIDTLYEIYDPITFRYPLDGSSDVESIDHSDVRYSILHETYHLDFAPDESRVIYPYEYGIAVQVDWFEDDVYTSHLSDITSNPGDSGNEIGIFIQEWHPNSVDVLAMVIVYLPSSDENTSNREHYLAIINSDTGDFEYVMADQNDLIVQARWYDNGNKIVIQRVASRCSPSCHETVIFDIETGEELILPFLGFQVGS